MIEQREEGRAIDTAGRDRRAQDAEGCFLACVLHVEAGGIADTLRAGPRGAGGAQGGGRARHAVSPPLQHGFERE